jgi:hypothetical protein
MPDLVPQNRNHSVLADRRRPGFLNVATGNEELTFQDSAVMAIERGLCADRHVRVRKEREKEIFPF